MVRRFKSALAKTWTLFLVGVVVLGLLLGAVRLLLPLASGYRAQVEHLLSEAAQLPIRIGAFRISLSGLVPQLALQDVELIDPGTGLPRMSFRRVRIGVDLTSSLRGRALKIESVTLAGARLVVKHRSDGSIVLAGLESIQAGNTETLGFFLNEGRLLLEDSEIYWENQLIGAPLVRYSEVRIEFLNAGERHQFNVWATLPGAGRARLEVHGDLRGNPELPAQWAGQMYLQWQGPGLGHLLEGRLPTGYRLTTGHSELGLWTRWRAGKLIDSQMRFHIQAVDIQVSNPVGPVPPQDLRIEYLRGQVRWRREATGWQLDLANLALSREGRSWPEASLSLRTTRDPHGRLGIQAGADFLRTQDLLAVTALFPVGDGQLNRLMADAQPRGDLHGFRFLYQERPDASPQWSTRVELLGVRTDPFNRLPGVVGLNGRLQADHTHGQVEVWSNLLSVDFQKLFRAPLATTHVRGILSWRYEPGPQLLHLFGDGLEIANADISTRTRVALRIPLTDATPFIDLHTDFHDAQLTQTRHYLPVGIMPPALIRWLEQAIVAGRVRSGSLILRGPLDAFPFREQEGRFELLFGAEEVLFDYHPEWPRLEDAMAEVRIVNQRLDVRVLQAKLLESEVVQARASIPVLRGANSARITGEVVGPFSDGLRILRETPLAKKLNRVTSGLETSGNTRVELDLSVPFRDGAPLSVEGHARWEGDASLNWPHWNLALDRLRGNLDFSEKRLYAKNIRARLWQQPVKIGVDTLQRQGGALTRIRARLPLSVPTLAKTFPQPAWRLLRGKTNWQIQIDIAHAAVAREGLPIRFALDSDLRGIAIPAPAPLGKSAEQARSFHLEGEVSSAPEIWLNGRYGHLWALLGLRRDASGEFQFDRGTVSLGQPATELPGDPGLLVRGDLEQLDLPAWLGWWLEQTPSGPARDPSAGPTLHSAQLAFARLILGPAYCSDVHLRLVRSGQTWEADIDGSEFSGSLRIPFPDSDDPLALNLERLDLKALFEQQTTLRREEVQLRADPQDAAPLSVVVSQLYWGKNPLGRLEVESHRRNGGLEYSLLSLNGPLVQFHGNGRWLTTAQGQRTELVLDATSPDLGRFLRQLEFVSLLDKAPATASLKLAWPDGPFALTTSQLGGLLQFKVDAGSLLEVSPGVGRFLGVLNLGALRRRLSLDFSDLFKKGYAFDRIEGSLALKQGKASTNDMTIEGVSALAYVSGNTNLVEQEYDQLVTVIPEVSTSLALAGAFAGGPLVGAAVFLADKVAGGQMDRLTQYQYRVTGPWADPVITRVDEDPDWSLGDLLAPKPKSDETVAKKQKNIDPEPELDLFFH